MGGLALITLHPLLFADRLARHSGFIELQAPVSNDPDPKQYGPILVSALHRA